VQNIVNSGPEKILFWRQVHEARKHLIEINQAKSEVESASRPLASEKQNEQANCSENEMKHVVRCSTARQASARENQKASRANKGRG